MDKLFTIIFAGMMVALVVAGWNLHVAACNLHIGAVQSVRDDRVRSNFERSLTYRECIFVTGTRR
jgi:hypothetical protein